MKCKQCGEKKTPYDDWEGNFCSESCMDRFYTGESKKQQHKYVNGGYRK